MFQYQCLLGLLIVAQRAVIIGASPRRYWVEAPGSLSPPAPSPAGRGSPKERGRGWGFLGWPFSPPCRGGAGGEAPSPLPAGEGVRGWGSPRRCRSCRHRTGHTLRPSVPRGTASDGGCRRQRSSGFRAGS